MRKIILTLLVLFSYALVYTQDMNGLLIEATKNNKLGQIQRLIKKGADVNTHDENKATVLMWAAYSGNIKTVKYLVSQKADCTKKGVIYINREKTSYYGNLLGVVAGENKVEILAFLIENCNIDLEDKEYDIKTNKATGWTAMQWAACMGNNEIIEILLENGASLRNNYNDTETTPLYIAVKLQKFETAKLLIEKGANINLIDKDGWGVLHYFAYNDQHELLKWGHHLLNPPIVS